MSKPILRARQARVIRGGVDVLHDVDLELHAGEVVAMLGPNGAGKSTLLAALSGLSPLRSGEIDVDGRVAAALQGSALASRSVDDNLRAALAWWGVPRAERGARAAAALGRMGASHLAARRATSLSGGEARRVHLARALALEPDVLLLDEPFAGLDAPTRAELLYDAASALRDSGRATLVVVHDRAEAWGLADRVVVMLAGRVEASGAPAELFARPPTAEVARFLGFSGAVREGDYTRLLRPQDVALDADGDLTAMVERAIPVEDGARLELVVPEGRFQAIAPLPGPPVGARVQVRLLGGVRFPRDGKPRQ
ncbi:MAG: ABC transporter ATP-binding protein [Actinomycetota bacterium]|nr:ABC transporter ATP-binding protein [Actinomycetota bacterium]